MIKNKDMASLVQTLAIIEPTIKNVTPITEWGQPNIYVDTGLPRLLPLHVLGYQFLHLLRLSLALSAMRDGIIIIDELEDGLHNAILPKVAKVIIQSIAESKVQFFISTHSSDLVKTFIQVAKEEAFDDMCLVNLMGGGGRVETRYFDRNQLEFANDYGAELR